jgi:hypothetical protein
MPRPELETRELIKRLRGRQGVILRCLPADLFLEYVSIENVINLAQGRESPEERELSSPHINFTPGLPVEGDVSREELPFFPAPKRVPLATHKANLVKYLDEHGATSRSRLLRELGIPPASLTSILKGPEFIQEAGEWNLKTKANKNAVVKVLNNAPMPLGAIMRITRLDMDTVVEILTGDEFFQTKKGMYVLKEERRTKIQPSEMKQPGPSVPTAK